MSCLFDVMKFTPNLHFLAKPNWNDYRKQSKNRNIHLNVLKSSKSKSMLISTRLLQKAEPGAVAYSLESGRRGQRINWWSESTFLGRPDEKSKWNIPQNENEWHPSEKWKLHVIVKILSHVCRHVLESHNLSSSLATNPKVQQPLPMSRRLSLSYATSLYDMQPFLKVCERESDQLQASYLYDLK